MNHGPSEGELELPEGYDDEVVRYARAIAREEIASLCGLVLRRCQSEGFDPYVCVALSSIFGEALNDYSKTENEPGRGPT